MGYKTVKLDLNDDVNMDHVAQTLAQWLDRVEEEIDGPDLEWYQDQDADWAADEHGT